MQPLTRPLSIPLPLFLVMASSLGCLELAEETPEDESVVDITPDDAPVARNTNEISPELFELLELWLFEYEHYNEADGSAVFPTFSEFVAEHDPALIEEAARMVPEARDGFRSHECSCRLISTVSELEENEKEYVPYGPFGFLVVKEGHFQWNSVADGAAHRGQGNRWAQNTLTEFPREAQIHRTQILTRLVCTDEDALPCEGACNAQMHVYSVYASHLYAYAETSGKPFSRSAHASAADAVTLTHKAPYQTPQVLFEKAGSVSHFGNEAAYDPNVVLKAIVGIALISAQIIITENPIPNPLLLDKTIDAVAVLVSSASGANGSSSQYMFAEYNPFSSGYFDMDFSSQANNVHTVTLSSYGQTFNRGYGPFNADISRYASSYLLSLAVDNLECDAEVTAPLNSCISRHATTPDAPYTLADLQQLKYAFYGVLGACDDTDDDGVGDEDDLCPWSIQGAEVDSYGCTGELVCNDGTYSPSCACEDSWQGCCAYHGGVAGCG